MPRLRSCLVAAEREAIDGGSREIGTRRTEHLPRLLWHEVVA